MYSLVPRGERSEGEAQTSQTLEVASVWAVEVEDFTDDLLHPLPMLRARAERRFLLSLRHTTQQQQPTSTS
jgi:hypothetical protein